MSWEEIYTAEETGNGEWTIFNEASFTGHSVFQLQSKESSIFYKDLMNEVYNQAQKDWWTGITVLHEVDGSGMFEPQFVSLNRLEEMYG